jgi:S-adenosylmethionine:tRNA ribosyltransferase-isomerase
MPISKQTYGEQVVQYIKQSIRAGTLRPGDRILLPEGAGAEIVERISDKKWQVRFHTGEPFDTYLDRIGRPPLPPYIRRDPGDPGTAHDRERYQTVYARLPGSVAAPTAGLHFTPDVFAELEKRKVRWKMPAWTRSITN